MKSESPEHRPHVMVSTLSCSQEYHRKRGLPPKGDVKKYTVARGRDVTIYHPLDCPTRRNKQKNTPRKNKNKEKYDKRVNSKNLFQDTERKQNCRKRRTNQGRLAANSQSSADGWIDGSMTIDVVNLYRSIWATARLTVALWTASGEEPSKQTLSSFFLARLTCTCKLTFFALYGSALQCSLRREFRPLFSSGTTCVCLGFSSFCLSRKFCPRMRHYRTALFSSRGRAASTSLDLILVFPSIPPHLFCLLCLISKHFLLCPVVPPLHDLILVLNPPFLHGEPSPLPLGCVSDGSPPLAMVLLEVQGLHLFGDPHKFIKAERHIVILCGVFGP